MIFRIAGLVFVMIAGGLLARTRWQIRRAPAAIAFSIALVGYVALQAVSPVEALEDAAASASWSWVAGLVGLAESAVLWLPIALFPWSTPSIRAATAAWIIGSALQAAVVFYRPFDVVVVNGSRVPESPAYVISMILFLPIVLLSYAICRRYRGTQVA